MRQMRSDRGRTATWSRNRVLFGYRCSLEVRDSETAAGRDPSGWFWGEVRKWFKTRGCLAYHSRSASLLPAHAGMVPPGPVEGPAAGAAPRARGDGPRTQERKP